MGNERMGNLENPGNFPEAGIVPGTGKAHYSVLGLMSGTSLDGLDILHVEFERSPSGKWTYRMGDAETIPYPAPLRDSLASTLEMSGLEISLLDVEYGHYTGCRIREFVERRALKVDFVAVHGHTVFHQPDRGLTLQIGDGAAIAVECGLPVVNRFRNTDVALGGQGAPLVPIGDALLFPEYDFCLNLGGISNISYEEKGKRIAFDISPCNLALNRLARREGLPFDRDGALAASGHLLPGLLEKLDALEFYQTLKPKSLGFEWMDACFWPVFSGYGQAETEDLLHTVTEHIASQIARVCRRFPAKRSLLLSGGGAMNLYLRERIASLSGLELTPVPRQIVEYKEALIFAFMGVLRMRGETNCLRSVTGACRDSIGGAVYLP